MDHEYNSAINVNAILRSKSSKGEFKHANSVEGMILNKKNQIFNFSY